MPYKLYISTKNSPNGSAVISQTNPTPIVMRDFVLGNTLDTNIYLVDGVSDFDSASGVAGYSVLVGIGRPGEGAVQLNPTWTQLENGTGWNGNLAFTDSRLADLFNTLGTNPLNLQMEVQVTDTQSRVVSDLLIPVKVFRRVIEPEDIAIPSFASDGEFSISNAADSGTVTGLNLASVPRRVLVSVRKPSGGLNLFASIVEGTITTGGFSFTLSGVTDATTYKLDYYLIF